MKEKGWKFSVYWKPTNKDNFVHYLSALDERTKMGIDIRFFLLAQRIYSQEFFAQEEQYIEDVFYRLRYSPTFVEREN